MARVNAYIKNAIAQLFDVIEAKCKVKFATFTASDSQGEKNISAGTREYMDDKKNNKSNGIYKYLYDPGLSFDFRFHQRLASAPFRKSNVPWVTIMFNVKQVRPLTNILSHVYTRTVEIDGKLRQFKTRRVSVPVDMVVVSNDMDKLYDTTEKIAMYFDRFINFHYDHTVSFEESKLEFSEEVVGHASNIREVNLDKLDTEHKGQIVSSAFQFDLVYWIVDDHQVTLQLLKTIILEIEIGGSEMKEIVVISESETE